MYFPSISIVVAVFNGAHTLQRCIDSVITQDYPDKEIIIMDGGSTDGTVDILRSNSRRIAYWESRRDRGIYHAWNKGLQQAHGEWIIFLGADDVLYNERVLETFVKKIISLNERPASQVKIPFSLSKSINLDKRFVSIRALLLFKQLSPYERPFPYARTLYPLFKGNRFSLRQLMFIIFLCLGLGYNPQELYVFFIE